LFGLKSAMGVRWPHIAFHGPESLVEEYDVSLDLS